jgi:16S rRNA (guanine966-N2)-methyltransferase
MLVTIFLTPSPSLMRIYGNRLIKTLPGRDTRPTTGRVREAVFNIWQGAIAGSRWLDLCAGNGSMGAEALCRGAALVVGIEQSSRACTIIKENWQRVAQPEQTFQVLRGDVVQRLKTLSGQQFDRIYFDPPYASDIYLPVMQAIAHYQLLHHNGELAVEHHPDLPKLQPSTLEICREKVYGNSAVTFYCVVNLKP